MPRKGVKGEEVTEEEKLLQLQQRAQAEEEMAGKKEETLTLYLKVTSSPEEDTRCLREAASDPVLTQTRTSSRGSRGRRP